MRVRSTDLNKPPAQVAKDTCVEKSSTDPEPLDFESPGGGRVQRCEGLRPPSSQRNYLGTEASAFGFLGYLGGLFGLEGTSP